jgi:hypothetical protein
MANSTVSILIQFEDDGVRRTPPAADEGRARLQPGIGVDDGKGRVVASISELAQRGEGTRLTASFIPPFFIGSETECPATPRNENLFSRRKGIPLRSPPEPKLNPYK